MDTTRLALDGGVNPNLIMYRLFADLGVEEIGVFVSVEGFRGSSISVSRNDLDLMCQCIRLERSRPGGRENVYGYGVVLRDSIGRVHLRRL